MKPINTILIVIFAVALGILYYVGDFSKKGGDPDAPTEEKIGKSLFAKDELAESKVKTLVLEPQGKPATEIARDEKSIGQWLQIKPIKFKLQSSSISAMISAAADLRYTAKLSPSGVELTPKQLDLDPPLSIVTLALEGDKTRKIKLGKTTAGGRAYLQLDGDASIYVVNDELHRHVLDRKLSELRVKTLADFTEAAVTRLQVTHDGKSTEFARKGADWVFSKPIIARADRQAIDGLISIMTGYLAEEFISDAPASPAEHGMDQPLAQLLVDVTEQAAPAAAPPAPPVAGDKKEEKKPVVVTHKLVIGAPADLKKEKYFARWDDSPVIFTVTKATVDKLARPIDEWRDARLTPIARTDIKTLELIHGAENLKLAFTLDGAQWKFAAPDPGFKLDAAAHEEFLNQILETRADGYLEAAKIEKPLATLKITLAGQTAAEELTIGQAADANQLVVLRHGETTGHLVKKGRLALVTAPAWNFRDKTVLDIQPDDVKSISIRRSGKYAARYDIQRSAPPKPLPVGPDAKPAEAKPDDKKTPEQLAQDVAKAAAEAIKKSPPGGWDLSGYDSQILRDLIGRLTPLHTTRWIGKKAPRTAPETAVIELTLQDGAKRTLKLYADSKEGELDGLDLVFAADPSILEHVGRELKNTAVLTLDPEQIATVSVGKLTIERTKEMKYELTDGSKVNEAKAAAIWEAMAGIKASHFLANKVAWPADAPAVSVKLKDGKVRVIRLMASEPVTGEPVAQVDDGAPFTLPKGLYETLTAKLVE